MNKKENEVIKRLLNLYPDVIEDLGGDAVVNSDSKIESIGDKIKSHKWFVNRDLPFTVNMDEAFFSWHENVYLPQKNAMIETNISSILNQYSKYDLFEMVSDEYYNFNTNTNDDISYYTNACYEVINRVSKSFYSRTRAQVKLARAS